MGDSITGAGLPGRRTVLFAAAGMAVSAATACSGSGTAPEPPVPAPPSSVPSARPTAAAPVRTAPATPTAASRPPLPSRASVVAAFGGRRPVQWGLEVPGVATRSTSSKAVLTFDACGGPGGTACDERLLDTLRELKVPATLFLNGRWIAANPALAAGLAKEPLFELANHGTAHLPLSVDGRQAYGIPGTTDVGAVYDELTGNQAVLEKLSGKPCGFFRSGTAHYDDVAAAIARKLGQVPVNFSVNGDAGATFAASEVAAALAGVRGGDIVIAHFNRPDGGTAAGYAAALPKLLERGVEFAHLAEVGARLV
ncbi:polysaccharide deacetylase [Arthrobacter sp. SW1]|uniref:polysaccharide deacetylase family protein n=1 Tax=Arthrobacter sp. SW1 TaxID=1920889 RepID=UPI000877B026|nr:polysaccharide deacetylase family protein [Arthrobacter sp. SW1]OFI38089.1 polysaccharide deacetylase [Arthrobacter sp. SW1]